RAQQAERIPPLDRCRRIALRLIRLRPPSRGSRYFMCWRIGSPKAFARPVFCLKWAFFSCILLLVGALVAIGDCIRAGRPRPASEPSVLSAPAPCAIANPQLPASNAAVNVNLVAFNIG